MFTNEKNVTVYKQLKENFNIYMEHDIISMLHLSSRANVSDIYSRLLLAGGLVAGSRIHICTSTPKLDRACDYNLELWYKFSTYSSWRLWQYGEDTFPIAAIQMVWLKVKMVNAQWIVIECICHFLCKFSDIVKIINRAF